jgi:deoxyribonuclease-4
VHRSATPELLGAHVSVRGGVDTAPARGVAIGATAIQVFTKTPNQWREPALSAETCAAFRRAVAESGLRGVVSHDSYLINLASPDPLVSLRSIGAFTAELERCKALGIRYLVSHPGNYIDDRDLGLTRNAAAYAHCLQAVPGRLMVLLETTAGTGTALGSTFEELAELRARIPAPLRRRIGFCADTCHLYSTGYDLVRDFDGVWDHWERAIGLRRLHCIHLNDSKTPFASRRDRHELIGEGSLGPEPFRRLMTDPRFARVIKVIETPKGNDDNRMDRKMLRRLRAYARTPARPSRLPRRAGVPILRDSAAPAPPRRPRSRARAQWEI